MPPLGLLQAFLCREVCRIRSHSRRQPGAGHTVTVTSAFRDTELSGRDKPFRSVLLTSLHIWLCWHLPRFLRQPRHCWELFRPQMDCLMRRAGQHSWQIAHSPSLAVSGQRFPMPILGRWSSFRVNPHVDYWIVIVPLPSAESGRMIVLSAKRCFAVKSFQCFQSSLEWFSWLQLVLQSWSG